MGRDGILNSQLSEKILADFSTFSPETAKNAETAVDNKGGSFLSLFRFQVTLLLREGRAALYVGGNLEAYQKILPVLSELSENISYTGTPDEALKLKLLINSFLFTQFQAFCEVLCLGERVGLERNKLINMINQSVTALPLIKQRSSYFKELPKTGLANLEQVVKDIDLIKNLSSKYSFDTLNLADNSFKRALELGLTNEDFYGVYKAFKHNKI